MKCSALLRRVRALAPWTVGVVLLAPLSVHLIDPDFAGLLVRSQRRQSSAMGGELYIKKGCIACHGPKGRDPTFDQYPRLAGQLESYSLAQILAIRDGARENGASSHMRVAIQGLTDAEAREIAYYLSLQ